jgi:hypothetical protein
MLLGAILGVFIVAVLGISSGELSSIDVVATVTMVMTISCGLAGLVIYPHKLSLGLIALGFLIAGSIGKIISLNSDFPMQYYTVDFIVFGIFFGIPAGALLSRILYWLKIIKD